MSKITQSIKRCEWKMTAPVISTAHISKPDSAKMSRLGCRSHACVLAEYEEGWIVSLIAISSAQTENNRRPDHEKMSRDYYELLKTIKAAGFEYVRFDRDACEIEGLKTYAW